MIHHCLQDQVQQPKPIPQGPVWWGFCLPLQLLPTTLRPKLLYDSIWPLQSTLGGLLMLFFFWPCCMAWGILVLWPGIELMPPCSGSWVLTTGLYAFLKNHLHKELQFHPRGTWENFYQLQQHYFLHLKCMKDHVRHGLTWRMVDAHG